MNNHVHPLFAGFLDGLKNPVVFPGYPENPSLPHGLIRPSNPLPPLPEEDREPADLPEDFEDTDPDGDHA